MKFDIKQAATYYLAIDNQISIVLVLCFLFTLNKLLPIIGTLLLKQPIQDNCLYIIDIIITSFGLAYFCKITNHRIDDSEDKKYHIDFNLKEFLKIFFCCLLISIIFEVAISCCEALTKNIVIGFCCLATLIFIESLSLISYSTDLKFKSLFNLNRIVLFVFYNFKHYISFILTVVLCSILFFILFILTSFTIIVPIILTAYYVLFIADIQAQFIKSIKIK